LQVLTIPARRLKVDLTTSAVDILQHGLENTGILELEEFAV
jgi:hypothetical protein